MAIKRIFSAGGIVFRPFDTTQGLRLRSGSSITDKGRLEVLVTQHSKHKGWDFPKGHIEEGESSKDAAIREVEEETGVKAEIFEKAGDTKYFYYEPFSAKASEGKEKVFKTVIYFLMKYVGDGTATTAFEVSALEWLAVEEVEEKLTFSDTKKLWRGIKERIKEISF